MAGYLHRIIALLTVLTVLASQAGLSVSRHYCGGHLAKVSIGLGHQLLSCGMEQPSMRQDTCSADARYVGRCCADEHHLFQLEEDIVPVATYTFALLPITALLLFVLDLSPLLAGVLSYVSCLQPDPPPRYCDCNQAFLQIFRI